MWSGDVMWSRDNGVIRCEAEMMWCKAMMMILLDVKRSWWCNKMWIDDDDVIRCEVEIICEAEMMMWCDEYDVIWWQILRHNYKQYHIGNAASSYNYWLYASQQYHQTALNVLYTLTIRSYHNWWGSLFGQMYPSISWQAQIEVPPIALVMNRIHDTVCCWLN